MSFRLDRAWVAFAVTFVAISIPFGLGVGYVVDKHRWAQGRLSELEPRYARLLGLQASADQLGRAATEAVERLNNFVYPESRDATSAGNDAQQRARKALEGAGLTIVSSQVLAAVVDDGYDRIPLSIRFEGTIPEIQRGLAALAVQSPVLLVDAFSMQTVGAVKADVPQRLSGLLVLSVLRVR